MVPDHFIDLERAKKRAEESGLASKLSPSLLWVGRLVTRRVEQAITAAGLGLTPAQGRVIVSLYLHAPVTQQALAALTEVEPSTLVSTLDVMEREGLARREPSPSDRRAHLVHLTDAGAELVPRLFELWDDVERDIARVLTETERADLHKHLQRLIAELSKGGFPCG